MVDGDVPGPRFLRDVRPAGPGHPLLRDRWIAVQLNAMLMV